MKTLQYLSACIAALFASATASAYDPVNHRQISTVAYDASQLSRDPEVVTSFGITADQWFPNSKGERRSIVQLIEDGVTLEDDFPRSLHHFFNPLDGTPLSVKGMSLGITHTSPDWILEDNGQKSLAAGFGEQEFSYRRAKQYQYDALTSESKKNREKNFGLMFQSVGHVIHHIQDMAQPQHVRNDQHLELTREQELKLLTECIKLPESCPILLPLNLVYFFGLRNPSLYEALTKSASFSLDGYPPVYSKSDRTTFNSPRKFWTSPVGGGKNGLADFTNWNFVSAGTNFDNSGKFILPAMEPLLNDTEYITAVDPDLKLKGKITFIGTYVHDYLTGDHDRNKRASTYSLFDAELTKAGKSPVYTLNRFNFEQARKFLIPRAVGYSAGMINYFFRAQLDWEEEDDAPGTYRILNKGPETMKGVFQLYYDDKEGNRYPVPGAVWEGEIAPNNHMGNISVPPILEGLPKPAKVGKYMLVFKGDMGNEKRSDGSVGAIAAKEIYAPILEIKAYAYIQGPLEYFSTKIHRFDSYLGREGAGEFIKMLETGSLVAENFTATSNGITAPCTTVNGHLGTLKCEYSDWGGPVNYLIFFLVSGPAYSSSVGYIDVPPYLRVESASSEGAPIGATVTTSLLYNGKVLYRFNVRSLKPGHCDFDGYCKSQDPNSYSDDVGFTNFKNVTVNEPINLKNEFWNSELVEKLIPPLDGL